MALVHEIALNDEFKIDERPLNILEKQVKEFLHKAFWDNFRENFMRESSDHSHELKLLRDIKKMLLDLLDNRHVRLRSEVEFMLDEKLLTQQIENNCLDIKGLSIRILDLMGRLCAPARDEAIAEIRGRTDVIEVFRGICELLETMKLDMANFSIRQYRPLIQQYAFEYERKQFQKLIEHNPRLEEMTFNWLRKHALSSGVAIYEKPTSCSPLRKRRFEELNNSEISDIISHAYMELLEWDDANPYPGTLMIDHLHLKALAASYFQLNITTCCLSVSYNLAGKDIVTSVGFKESLKNEMFAILKGVTSRTINDQLEAVFLHCNSRIEKSCLELKCSNWTKECSETLRKSLFALSDENNSVRKLICKRLYALFYAKVSSFSFPRDILMRFTNVQQEILAVAGPFIRIVSHNRQVFGTYYGKLIQKALSEE